MAVSKSFVCLLSCLVLLALVAPTLAVNRLFVDKLSGYHQELVTAEDIDTDLLRTTLMVVGAGVDMSSTEDHVINTVGSIALDGTELSFSATNSIDISSFGGNVRFAADTVSVSADEGGVISAVEATIHADDLSLTYGTFEVDGADTTIRSLGDIDFLGTDLEMDAADRVGIVASTIDMNFGGTFSASSDQSNLQVNAGKAASFATSQSMDITGQSGVDIISFHDELALSSELGDATFSGENAEIRGLHSIGIAADGDIDLTAERISTNSDSVQFVADGDIEFTAENGLTLAANGHALVSAAELNASAEDINVNSARDLLILSAGDVGVVAGNDVSGTAATIHAHAGDDFTATSGASLTLDSGYEMNIESESDDVIFAASASGLTLAASIVSLYSAEGTFTLQADALNIEFDDRATFEAENSLSFFVDGTIDLDADDFDVDSHGSISLQATQDFTLDGMDVDILSSRDISFTAGNDGILLNAEDMTFQMRDTFQATTDGELGISSDDTIDIRSEGDVELHAGDDSSLEADEFNLTGRTIALGSQDTISFTAQSDIDLETSVGLEIFAGGSLVIDALEFMDFNAFLIDISSDSGDLDFSSSNDLVISGEGGQLYTSTELNSISVETAQFIADDVFSIFQTIFVSGSDITFTGDWEFGATIDREGTIEFDGEEFELTADEASFIGGSITIEIDDFDWTSNDLVLQSSNGQDITHESASDLSFDGTTIIASMPFITYEAGNLAITGGTADFTFAASAGSILVNTETSTLFTVADEFTATATAAFSTGLISGATGITFQALAGVNQSFGSSFVQSASGSITYDATENISLDFVSDSTVTVTTGDRATYASDNEELRLLADEDIVFIGTDTDVTVGSTLQQEATTLNYVSRGLVRFDAADTFVVMSVGDHNVLGGDIVIDASNDLIYNVDSLTFGAVPPTEANPSDGTVTVDAGGDSTFTFAELVQMDASGNNPYVDEAITILAEAGTVNFLANNAANGLEFNGNNGVNVTTNTASVLSQQGIQFIARTGSFIAEAFGDDPDVLTLQAFNHDGVTPSFSVRAQADLASVVTHAHDDIDVASGNFVFSGTEGVSVTNFNSGDMTHQVTDGSISKTAGGNYIVTAGEEIIITADDINFTFGGDLLMHSLFDDAAPNTRAIEFDSFSAATSEGTQIGVVGGFYGYPSGTFVAGTDNAGSSVALSSGLLDYGTMKFGSKTGTFQINSDADAVGLTAGGQASVRGGGVDGHVNTLADGDATLTVGQDFIVASNADSSFLFDDTLTLTTTRTATFSSDSETEGISQLGDNIAFVSALPAGATDGISVHGHYVVMNGDDEVSFLAAEWTIGENNQQHNPVVLVNAASMEQTTVGTVQYTVANDLFAINSETTVVTSENGNVLLTSGGDQIFETTWATGVAGEGLLSLEAASGQITIIADNTIESETGTATYEADTINLITQGNSPSSNIVVQANYNVNFEGDVDMDVLTNAHFVTGAIDFVADDITLSSSEGTFDIVSDHDMDIISTGGALTVVTAANNAHIEMQTLGDNADIIMNASVDVVLTAAGDAEFTGDSVRLSSGDPLTLEATSGNNGKLQLDASGEVRISGATSLTASGDNVFFDAVGEDSTFRIDINDALSVDTTEELHFENNPGEGGSIIFRGEALPATADGDLDSFGASISGDMDVDIDGDFLIDTQGSVTIDSGNEMDFTVGGYTDLHASDVELTAETSSVALEANAASVRFAGQGTFVSSAENFFTAADGFSANVVGNNTDSALEIFGEDIGIISENSATFSAYETVQGISFGYINFRALNSIDAVTTYPGGDIVFSGERMEIDGEHILVNVTAGAGSASTVTRSIADQNERDTSGSIRIDNDDQRYRGPNSHSYAGFAYWNIGEFNPFIIPVNVDNLKVEKQKATFAGRVRASMPQSERDYWYNGADFSSDSLNIFKGAEELSVDSEQGDVRFEYASDLLLASNHISGFSSGGIEIHAYGEGRRSTPEYDEDATTTDEAIIFGDLTSINFRTDNSGSGEIRVQSEQGAVSINSEGTTTIRAGNDNLYFSASSTLSILKTRQTSADDGEVDFTSAGDIHIRSFDDDVNVFAESITFGALANDAINFSTSSGLDGIMDFQVSQTVSGTFAGDVTISSSAGDVYFTASCPNCFGTDMTFSADVININHADDAFFEFSSSLRMAADTVTLTALPATSPVGAYFLGDSGVVRFDGRKTDNHEDSDREVFRPTVTFSDELSLNFDSTSAHNSHVGGFCEFDRAIAFEESAGVNNRYQVCICLDHTWQCRAEDGSPFDSYFWAPNPYDPLTYYPN